MNIWDVLAPHAEESSEKSTNNTLDIVEIIREEINSKLPLYTTKIQQKAVSIVHDNIQVLYLGRVSIKCIKANMHDPNCLDLIVRKIEEADTDDLNSYKILSSVGGPKQ